MRDRNNQIYCIFFLIIVFISCRQSNGDATKKEKQAVAVDIMIASKNNLDNKIEVNGVVLANEMVELRPETSGRLVYLNLPDGEKVIQGYLLAKINDAELQAQLEQQKSQLELASKNEKRLKDLLSINGVNQADYDAALNQLNVINASIKITAAQIEKTNIKAPFTGELGLRQVSLGAYVTPQTLIGTLHQTDEVKVDFTVPESYSHILFKGKSITININGLEKNINGIITAIEPQINTQTRNIKVRAKINQTKINPGSFVKVILSEKLEGITIPTNAIIPDASSNQVVLVKNGKAQFKNVNTGIRNEEMVLITSGINEGDSIIINGILFVRPGAKVKIKSVKK